MLKPQLTLAVCALGWGYLQAIDRMYMQNCLESMFALQYMQVHFVYDPSVGMINRVCPPHTPVGYVYFDSPFLLLYGT